MLNAWIADFVSRCGYHAEDGRWSDCKHFVTFKYLWWDCCLMLQSQQDSGVPPCKLTTDGVQKPCLLQLNICANIDFPHYFIWKKVSESFEPSIDLRVAWVIVCHNKKVTRFFCLSSKVWKLNRTTEYMYYEFQFKKRRYCKTGLFLWFFF